MWYGIMEWNGHGVEWSGMNGIDGVEWNGIESSDRVE